ncbi:hypothetical protein [Ekhidna sp.]
MKSLLLETSQNNNIASTQLTHRITIAWSISECALGGIMHTVQSPFTGLIVGGLSVLFIALIAFHAEKPATEILKSVVFVLGIKLAISPHAPIGAFFAVALQASLGALFFHVIRNFTIAALFTAILSLVLSAIQKIIILTILFGVNFWEAIDQFSKSLITRLSISEIDFSLSNWLIFSYIGLYTIGGLIVGIISTKLPSLFHRNAKQLDERIASFPSLNLEQKTTHSPKRKWIMLLLIILVVLFIQVLFLSYESAITQLVRTIIIISVWLIIARPVLAWGMKRIFHEKQASLTSEIEAVQVRIPILIGFGQFAWKHRKQGSGYPFTNFMTLYLYYAIYKL